MILDLRPDESLFEAGIAREVNDPMLTHLPNYIFLYPICSMQLKIGAWLGQLHKWNWKLWKRNELVQNEFLYFVSTKYYNLVLC